MPFCCPKLFLFESIAALYVDENEILVYNIFSSLAYTLQYLVCMYELWILKDMVG